jgi:hypothetical protein
MTLVTPLKEITHSVWNRRTLGNEVPVIANGSDIFLTAGVTQYGETGPDVDLCAEDEQLSGIICGQADDATSLDKDSDDPFDDNTPLHMAVPIPGEEVYLTAKTAGSITKDKVVQCDGGFFEDIDFSAGQTSANVPYAGSMLLQAKSAITGVSGLEQIFLAKRV